MTRLAATLPVLIACVLGSADATAGQVALTEAHRAAALALLPPAARADAEVLVGDSAGEHWTVAREGTNEWSCRVRITDADRLVARCNHRAIDAFPSRTTELHREGYDGAEAHIMWRMRIAGRWAGGSPDCGLSPFNLPARPAATGACRRHS